MKEIFKPIPGWPDYQVSNLGNIKSLKFRKRRILKPGDNGKGYLIVGLITNGNRKFLGVHVLVAMAFHGHVQDGNNLVVDHINRNRKNNRADNLRVISNRENTNQKHRKSSSKYTGVYWNKSDKIFRASIWLGNYQFYLGRYKNERRASIAYDLALFQIDQLNKLVNN